MSIESTLIQDRVLFLGVLLTLLKAPLFLNKCCKKDKNEKTPENKYTKIIDYLLQKKSVSLQYCIAELFLSNANAQMYMLLLELLLLHKQVKMSDKTNFRDLKIKVRN